MNLAMKQKTIRAILMKALTNSVRTIETFNIKVFVTILSEHDAFHRILLDETTDVFVTNISIEIKLFI